MPHSPSGASARPSPHVLIKSLEKNALHTSRIRDMVRLNGNRSKSRAALLKSLNVEHDTLPRIAAAYVYFSEVIQDFVDQGGVGGLEQKDHRIFGLMQALRTALQFVLIELEENDDPQVIFETLNARGQPL